MCTHTDTDVHLVCSFVSLLEEISYVKPQTTAQKRAKKHSEPRAKALLRQWIASLARPLPPRTGTIFFRLFFPEEDNRRRYNMQEAQLASSIAEALCLTATGDVARGKRLIEWAHTRSVGCLGLEVRRVLSDVYVLPDDAPKHSLEDVDRLLDELASLSSFSVTHHRTHPKRSRVSILRDLYMPLSPSGAAFMTQIILQDLRPLLYPLEHRSTHTNLLEFKSNAVSYLTKWEVMKVWHTDMPRIYNSRAHLDDAAQLVEDLENGCSNLERMAMFDPTIGTPVEIPKCDKGLSCALVIKKLRKSSCIWAELKYDGER